MAGEWNIAVSLVLAWRWRCETERLVVPGSELCVAKSSSGHLIPLAQSDLGEAPRASLRHACGSPVTPVTPERP